VERQRVHEVPLSRHARTVAAHFGAAEPDVFVSEFGGLEFTCRENRMPSSTEIPSFSLASSISFPTILLLTTAEGTTHQLSVRGSLTGSRNPTPGSDARGIAWRASIFRSDTARRLLVLSSRQIRNELPTQGGLG